MTARELKLLSPVLIQGTIKEAKKTVERLETIARDTGGLLYKPLRQLDIDSWAVDFGFTDAESYQSYLAKAREEGILQ